VKSCVWRQCRKWRGYGDSVGMAQTITIMAWKMIERAGWRRSCDRQHGACRAVRCTIGDSAALHRYGAQRRVRPGEKSSTNGTLSRCRARLRCACAQSFFCACASAALAYGANSGYGSVIGASAPIVIYQAARKNRLAANAQNTFSAYGRAADKPSWQQSAISANKVIRTERDVNSAK